MKLRTGKSPDHADSVAGLVALCIERLKFKVVGMEGQKETRRQSFGEKAKKVNSFYERPQFQDAQS